jgi:hypothetical protein
MVKRRPGDERNPDLQAQADGDKRTNVAMPPSTPMLSANAVMRSIASSLVAIRLMIAQA